MSRCSHQHAIRIGLPAGQDASLACGPWVQWCLQCGAHRTTYHYGGDEPWTLPPNQPADFQERLASALRIGDDWLNQLADAVESGDVERVLSFLAPNGPVIPG